MYAVERNLTGAEIRRLMDRARAARSIRSLHAWHVRRCAKLGVKPASLSALGDYIHRYMPTRPKRVKLSPSGKAHALVPSASAAPPEADIARRYALQAEAKALNQAGIIDRERYRMYGRALSELTAAQAGPRVIYTDDGQHEWVSPSELARLMDAANKALSDADKALGRGRDVTYAIIAPHILDYMERCIPVILRYVPEDKREACYAELTALTILPEPAQPLVVAPQPEGAPPPQGDAQP
jgi:hypothetical protein